ncbi:hypothetical protein Nepgr_002759 [Nepenthes gracilis]|uniref:BTB domain-containing protein n=1 Tax=Nepenthes gracilis TaxID=150966 RepID=A0AAD3RYK5_NEPGR|nr:hypothetical protein Nepgr_002759 [Nepenthes gracilis]
MIKWTTSTMLRCLSCKEEYGSDNAGTCKDCYEEASETEEELKREIEDLKAKIAFLRFWSPLEHHNFLQLGSPSFTDVVLVASDEHPANPVSFPAHKAVLTCRSPVFKAMLETDMEERLSGIIKISDISNDTLRCFVDYLYTAEACLDEQMARDLLVLAEKYEVKYLKAHCEKFLVSKLNWDNLVTNFGLAQQHNAKILLDASLSMITDNMSKFTKTPEYAHLVEKDPRLVVEIFEAYLSKAVNTAAKKD